jgi:hypothetical protein
VKKPKSRGQRIAVTVDGKATTAIRVVQIRIACHSPDATQAEQI